VPTQFIQQRFHLVRQLSHVRKAECGCSTLDGMCTPENGVQFFVVGCFKVEIQEHLLHLVKVFPCFFEEDFVELGKID